MKAAIRGLAPLIWIVLAGCAPTRVDTRADLKAYEGKGIGFAAFSYASTNPGSLDLEVRDAETGKSFLFDLSGAYLDTLHYAWSALLLRPDRPPDRPLAPLTLAPLPAGRYVCFRVVFKAPASVDVLSLEQPGARKQWVWPAPGDAFEIAGGKTTYIGSYTGRLKYGSAVLGLRAVDGMDIKVADELETRAAAMGIRDSIRKQLCRLGE